MEVPGNVRPGVTKCDAQTTPVHCMAWHVNVYSSGSSKSVMLRKNDVGVTIAGMTPIKPNMEDPSCCLFSEARDIHVYIYI